MRLSFLRAFLFTCLITLTGDALELWMHDLGLTPFRQFIFENILTGILAGAFIFFFLEERRRNTAKRVEEIAFLNHHIRNALTAINLSRYAGDDSLRLNMVADASQRIEATLRKISQQEHVSLEDASPYEI